MESLPALLGIAVLLFAWTNIDDLVVLLGFFSNPKFRARDVVIGQSLGIAALYGVSALASMLSIVIPPAYIGLIGLAPIVLGVAKLVSLWRGVEPDSNEHDARSIAAARAGTSILTVALATVANGGDNISVYTSLFATRTVWEVALVGLVFVPMIALWCFLGHWLVHHPALGAPLRRYGHVTLPFFLIGIGIWVLVEDGTLNLL